MKKYLTFILLVLVLCSCGEETLPEESSEEYIDKEFGMNCVGVVRGSKRMSPVYVRCENKETVCYVGYDGKSISCKWKGEK